MAPSWKLLCVFMFFLLAFAAMIFEVAGTKDAEPKSISTGCSESVQAKNDWKTVADTIRKVWSEPKGVFGTGRPIKDLVEELEYVQMGGVNIYSDAYISSKPLVAFLGQYSSGKTTIIEELLGANYPGAVIAPDAATDKFTLIVGHDGTSDQTRAKPVEQGRGAAAGTSFEPYTRLGEGFLKTLSKVYVSTQDAPLLSTVNILDTPGILSNKVKEDGAYDPVRAWENLAQHADIVFIVFDVHKSGDISERFQRCLQYLAGTDDKVYFLLNKADMLTPLELTSTYGGIMWQMGRVFAKDETKRMWFGSFWNKTCNVDVAGKDSCAAFDQSKQNLLDVLQRIGSTRDAGGRGRLASFERFVERLDIAAKLLREIQARASTWFSCVEPPFMATFDTFSAEVASIAQANFWPSSELPNLSRMYLHLYHGKVCNKPEPARDWDASIQVAKDDLSKAGQSLGSFEEPASGFWGMVGGTERVKRGGESLQL